jgi:hypothetical protein
LGEGQVKAPREIDWHGTKPHYIFRTWIGERLVYDNQGDGAWPKPVYPEPPCGWDERDALV